ncbi:hypothetical protein B0H16DRAFT_1469315 [Mycena metata]|uniref:Uncharacterized protein n=1 Tax=Mycena metata TaxID=1033252 RepID=A0AAD7HYJ2_9AGAR|nr:hypothetical protein B0H16DRAFT_1469315 [Mycena metata]
MALHKNVRICLVMSLLRRDFQMVAHILSLTLSTFKGGFALEWAGFKAVIRSVSSLVLSVLYVEFSGLMPDGYKLHLPALVRLLALSCRSGDAFVGSLDAPSLSVLSITADASLDDLEMFCWRENPLLARIGAVELTLRFAASDTRFIRSIRNLLAVMSAVTCLDLRPSVAVSPIMSTIATLSISPPTNDADALLLCPLLNSVVTCGEVTAEDLAAVLIQSHLAQKVVVARINAHERIGSEFVG